MFRHLSAAPLGEERKDLFGPVADLMVGVVFIFIILLLGLSLYLQPEDYQHLRDRNAQLEAENARLVQENRHLRTRSDQLKASNERLKTFARYVRDHQVNALFERIAAANETRAQLLESMRRNLDVLGVQVTIDPMNGTLRLPSGGLFLAGQSEPTAQGREILLKLGEVLAATLPCYSDTRTPAYPIGKCPQTNVFTSLSSAYIEGHTDIVPISHSAGRFRDNWELSAGRAIETFKLLRESYPILRELRNQDGDTLLGVSGYAETRPATKSEDRRQEAVRDLDRRIEVRLTMTANEAAVRKALEELNGQLEAINDLVQ
jgi:chemotaxis protein MotB